MHEMENNDKNKYDSPLELEYKNTLSVILKGIKPDSMILEFGPASGRMTKYMKEELHCDVYIVEIDDVAFKNAIQFAKEGILGDIMSFDWLRRFSNIRFDYIIFADVLEHLSDPLKVLEKSSELLKEYGRIYFSIPNIAYSGVIYELLQNRFEYRKTGILDNTHIHFFTKNSALEMIAQASLVPISIDEINNQISNSEFQSDNGLLPRDLKGFLEELDFGHVYQYVFCVMPKALYVKNADILKTHDIPSEDGIEAPSYLYLDCGQGYNEHQKVIAVYHSGKNIKVVFSVSQFQDIAAVRWDIICKKPCTISSVSANCNGVLLENISANSIFNKEDVNVFFDGKAMFNFKNTVKAAKEITFTATVEPLYATDNCKSFLQDMAKEHETAMHYIELLEYKESMEQNQSIEQQKSIAEQQKLIEEQQKSIAEQQKLIEKKNDQKQQLIAEINHNSENIQRLEEENTCLTSDKENLSSHVAELSSTVADLNSTINDFRQSEFWKLTWPARVFVSRARGFRHRIRMRTAKKPRNQNQIEPTAEENSIIQIEPLAEDNAIDKIETTAKTSLEMEKPLVLTPAAGDVAKRQHYNTVVSVIIPTYNAGEEFSNLLFLLKSQKGIQGIEIIIVDSGSKDHTTDIARFFGVQLIEIPQKDFTHSYARNLGAKKANGKFLLFMTQDAIPTDDTWLYRFISPIVGDEIVAATCAETPRANTDLAYRVNMWYHYNFLGISNSDRIGQEPESPDFISLRRNGQLSDVACVIKASVFKKYLYSGSYAEDLDLGIKLIRDSYKIAFLSSVKVIHSHNRSCSYYMKRAFVDKGALIGILPDFPVAQTGYEDLISAILNGYAQTCAFLNCLIDEEMKNEQIDTCFSKMNAFRKSSTAAGLPEPTYGYEYSDETLDAFISRVQQLSEDITVTGTSLFPNVCDFVEGCFKPYIEQHYSVITPDLKLEIVPGIFKRFATNVGDALADYSIMNQSGDALTALAAELKDGV